MTKSVFLLSNSDSGKGALFIGQHVLKMFEVVLEKSSAVLHGLLTSIPTFWGPDALAQMVNVYVDHGKVTSGSPKAPVSSLMRAITKKVPSKVLLPSLLDNWAATASYKNLVSREILKSPVVFN